MLREQSRDSVVFTELRRNSRVKLGGFVSIDGGRVCLLKCNREVTVYVDIKAVAVCLYKSDGGQV